MQTSRPESPEVENVAPETESETEQIPEETLQLLLQYQERFTRNVTIGLNRIERLEMLMKRKKAQTWKPEKTAKFIRRIQSSQKSIEENANMLEQVNFRLQQHTPSV